MYNFILLFFFYFAFINYFWVDFAFKSLSYTINMTVGEFFFRNEEKASCTALSTFEQDVVSVGEDGAINLLTAHQTKPVRVIGKQ